MIFHVLLAISFFIAFFLIRIKRDYFYALAKNSVGLVNELITDADEDEKIVCIQRKTNQLALALLKMLLLLVVAFVLGAVPLIVFLLFAQQAMHSSDFMSLYAIIAISLGATVAFLIPLRKNKNAAYSELSQLLHYMALDNYNIMYKLFRRETKKQQKKGLQTRNDFVIVSGLARAGTTSLMNDLSQIEDFVTLSYANMPFLMIPQTWRKIYRPKSQKLKERSHKDGILIGYNSNEALEEYFFKVKANDAYIQEDFLSEYAISEADYADYLDYQSNIKQDNKKIYLAKNNNFILRYKSMRSYNDDFVMVLLFRDPLTHAASLKEKHAEYLKMQQEDSFILDYMNWLGHHEFGQNQKPFVFEDSPLVIAEEKSSLDYWLKIWINYYSYALNLKHPNTLFVNYDSYCKNPKQTVDVILEKTAIQNHPIEGKPFHNKRKSPEETSADLKRAAVELYAKLLAEATN